MGAMLVRTDYTALMTITGRITAVATMVATLSVPQMSSAAQQGTTFAVKSLRCTFPRFVATTWSKDGLPETNVRAATLVLRFEAIDPESGTAQLRNGSMLTEVTARLAEGYLHLMQAFRTGPLYTTTIFGVGANAGKLKAVHSRHEYFTVSVPGATSSPEQYYGECEVVR